MGATTTNNISIHKDAKFNLSRNADSFNFIALQTAVPHNVAICGKTATVNIDGQDKEVYVAAVEKFTAKIYLEVPNYLTVDNGDGTYSIKDYTVTAGEYVSNSENTIVINGKTYTEASDGTNTIYYCAK